MKFAKWFGLLLFAVMVLPGHAQEGEGDVVYVPTPQHVVDSMLDMAKVGPKDYLIDLGSGDGRIVITAASKFGASGLGVDLDQYLLRLADQNARKAGVTGKVLFVGHDLFEIDLSRATVISSYLLPELNLRLRPKIMALKPGTRVIAHDYDFGAWAPDQLRKLIAPEKTVGEAGVSYAYLYVVPAQVPGSWRSLVKIGGRDTPMEFNLVQEFQYVEGGVDIRDRKATLRGRIMGEQIRMVAGGGNGIARHEFKGRIDGDRINGTVTIGDGAAGQQLAWTANQIRRGELKRAADEWTPEP